MAAPSRSRRRGWSPDCVEAHLAASSTGEATPVELVTIATAGDRDSAAEEAGSGSRHPVDEGLPAGGDKSRWVNELERALSAGEIDLAVHSAKDVPGELAEGLALLGAPARAPAESKTYESSRSTAIAALAALGLALFIAVAGFRIGKRTVNTLVDAAPKGLASQIRSIAQTVPGVVKVETLRLRPAGAGVFGDIAFTVSRTLPLEKAAAIEANVAAAIAARHPEVAVTVAAQPIALDDETMLERVLLIAAKRRVPVHHVTIQEIEGRTAISFDVELDGRMTLGNAHEIVSGLESEIGHELGPGIEVETHIEPLEPRPLQGHDAPPETRAEIAHALAKMVSGTGPIRDVHGVLVRTTPDGLVVNYHCLVSPYLSVDEVHEHVDELDRKMRAAFTGIVRIVGHAEPLRA